MPASTTIHASLLHALLTATAPIRLELLSARIRLSPADLARELESLRAVGCEFETHPEHGVRLLRAGLGAWSDYLAEYARLRDGRPRRVEIYRKTASTQELARRMIESIGPDANLGIACANEQTTGRGRLGRKWLTLPGKSLAFTMAFAADAGSARITVDRLMFATAVGVARAIDRIGGPTAPPVRIKWPNDILIHQKKVAGVLVETFQRQNIGSAQSASGNVAAIIGVGLNVNLDPHDLDELDPSVRSHITSLNFESIFTDRLRLLAQLLHEMDAALIATDNAALIEEWRSRCTHLDQRMTLLHNGQKITGHVVDLDPFDGLIVRTDTGIMTHLPAASTTFA